MAYEIFMGLIIGGYIAAVGMFTIYVGVRGNGLQMTTWAASVAFIFYPFCFFMLQTPWDGLPSLYDLFGMFGFILAAYGSHHMFKRWELG